MSRLVLSMFSRDKAIQSTEEKSCGIVVPPFSIHQIHQDSEAVHKTVLPTFDLILPSPIAAICQDVATGFIMPEVICQEKTSWDFLSSVIYCPHNLLILC
jgi:hypothetical protein